MAISRIDKLDSPIATPETPAGRSKESESFASALAQAVNNVDQKNAEANVAVAGMLRGEVDVHQTMIALHEAEETLEITTAIKNKFVQAYQDIMKMPI